MVDPRPKEEPAEERCGLPAPLGAAAGLFVPRGVPNAVGVARRPLRGGHGHLQAPRARLGHVGAKHEV